MYADIGKAEKRLIRERMMQALIDKKKKLTEEKMTMNLTGNGFSGAHYHSNTSATHTFLISMQIPQTHALIPELCGDVVAIIYNNHNRIP